MSQATSTLCASTLSLRTSLIHLVKGPNSAFISPKCLLSLIFNVQHLLGHRFQLFRLALWAVAQRTRLGLSTAYSSTRSIMQRTFKLTWSTRRAMLLLLLLLRLVPGMSTKVVLEASCPATRQHVELNQSPKTSPRPIGASSTLPSAILSYTHVMERCEITALLSALVPRSATFSSLLTLRTLNLLDLTSSCIQDMPHYVYQTTYLFL